MASCSVSRQQVLDALHALPTHRAHEKLMAEKLFEWADKGLISSRPKWNKRNEHAEPLQCGVYRPDFVFERDVGVVIEECDENGHRSYKMRCELIRHAHVSLGYGGRPVHWIRIDTDITRVFGSLTLDSGSRDHIHLRRLQMAERIPDYDHFIKIDYLFYRPLFGNSPSGIEGVQGILQSFQFPTIEDYCKWVDKVAPESINEVLLTDETTQLRWTMEKERELVKYKAKVLEDQSMVAAGDVNLEQKIQNVVQEAVLATEIAKDVEIMQKLASRDEEWKLKMQRTVQEAVAAVQLSTVEINARTSIWLSSRLLLADDVELEQSMQGAVQPINEMDLDPAVRTVSDSRNQFQNIELNRLLDENERLKQQVAEFAAIQSRQAYRDAELKRLFIENEQLKQQVAEYDAIQSRRENRLSRASLSAVESVDEMIREFDSAMQNKKQRI